MLRWLSLAVVAGVLTGFTLLLVTGEYINDGPVLIRMSATRGLHVGDAFVLLGWAASMLALGRLVTLPGQRHR
ncbi:hypothetical protein [Blastococcus goldschmidtiae]|uniref:Uncharacterized protein n=1 Tax=Blastococcus goldschmidtiae TaxID=3075546 RepID=A0ABU2KAX2_9ACTN|nr:hypothetical protein [Blastococcus sp. DSM 46792]MDT0277344.1 hypothetical protein [Blastococcus sp. DSM 46792]